MVLGNEPALILRRAVLAEAPDILVMYQSQVGRGDSDWDEMYPNREVLLDDLAGGFQYVVTREGEIVGALSMHTEDEHLVHLPWTPGDALYLSRLCVTLARQRTGLGTAIVRLALAEAARRGLSAVRLLCSQTNATACRLYDRLGFDARGTCRLFDTDFIALEKSVREEDERNEGSERNA